MGVLDLVNGWTDRSAILGKSSLGKGQVLGCLEMGTRTPKLFPQSNLRANSL